MAGIYLSFQAVVLARLVAGTRGWMPEGEYSLGRWGMPVAAAALAYGAAMIVNLCWPRPTDAVAGWLTLAAALLILVPGALLARGRR